MVRALSRFRSRHLRASMVGLLSAQQEWTLWTTMMTSLWMHPKTWSQCPSPQRTLATRKHRLKPATPSHHPMVATLLTKNSPTSTRPARHWLTPATTLTILLGPSRPGVSLRNQLAIATCEAQPHLGTTMTTRGRLARRGSERK